MFNAAENTAHKGYSAYTVADAFEKTTDGGASCDLVAKEFRTPAHQRAYVRVQTGILTAATLLFALNAGVPATLLPRDGSATGEADSLNRQLVMPLAQFGHLLAELDELRDFQPGWDGLGSISPSADSIDDAIAFLELLPYGVATPDVTASADGEVGIYWNTSDSYIDVGFKGDSRISYYASARGYHAEDIRPFDRASLPDDLLRVIRHV